MTKKSELSEAQKARFDEWFEIFWYSYDKKYTDNCTPKKGAKPLAKRAARNALNRYKKDTKKELENFIKECDLALFAQKKYWDEAILLSKWMPNFPMVATWFNQERWGIELDSHAELKESIKKPAHKQAEKPLLGKVTDINKANEYRANMKKILRKS